jgi:outer membrane protein TolC
LIENFCVKIFRTPHKTWAFLLIGGTLTIAPSLLSAQVTLAKVVDLAQRNSSAVKIAEANERKASASLAQTIDVLFPSGQFASGLPVFPSVGFSGSPPSIFTGSVEALIFSPSQKKYIDSARDGVRAAKLSSKNAREEVALDASTFYIELDMLNRQLDAAREQEKLSARLIEIEQQRAESGIDPLSELLQAQLTAAQLRLKRIHLETRAGTLIQELVSLTGLPADAITPDHASIPDIPQIRAHQSRGVQAGIESAKMVALSKEKAAKGDWLSVFMPQAVFSAQYSRYTTFNNNANSYYKHDLKSDNFSSGIQIQIPLFDWVHRDKAKESAADALRAKVEAEQAQRQNEVQIATLTGSLRELDAQAEIASLKQQIADEQLHAVLTQMELGNGSGAGATAQPQLSPKAEQLARIDERQKYQDAQDAALDLSKTRLNLLRVLGHMEDWLNELHTK